MKNQIKNLNKKFAELFKKQPKDGLESKLLDRQKVKSPIVIFSKTTYQKLE